MAKFQDYHVQDFSEKYQRWSLDCALYGQLMNRLDLLLRRKLAIQELIKGSVWNFAVDKDDHEIARLELALISQEAELLAMKLEQLGKLTDFWYRVQVAEESIDLTEYDAVDLLKQL